MQLSITQIDAACMLIDSRSPWKSSFLVSAVSPPVFAASQNLRYFAS
jgi:hypothetical protein